jgi:hypothetical protein
MAGDGYPKRESHFAHKLTRLLLRTCAAQEIGPAACYLVVQIVHTEDAAHYRRAVTFWNDQLMSVLGFSWGQLDRARKKATAGGWLHYEAGTKGTAGRYWSTIPPEYEGLPDGAIDEDFIHTSAEESAEETPDSSAPVESQTGGNGDIPPHQCGGIREESGRNPGGMCGTFKPNPSPTKAHAAHAVASDQADDNGGPLPPGETPDDVAFYDVFWRVVPRKVDKEKAHKAFVAARKRLTKLGQTPAEARAFLVERMAAFAASPKAQGQYCPYPATWLNGGRYDDDPAEWNRTDGKPTTHGHRNESGRPAVKSIEA